MSLKPVYCKRIKTLIGSWDFKPGYLSLCRMRCRQWDCEYCAVRNADMWRGHLLHVFCEEMVGKKWVFLTLTVPPWAHTLAPAISLKVLKKAWDGMYDRLRWLNRGKFSYVLVFETHASGVFHVHALCDLGAHYDKYTVWDFSTGSRAEIIANEKMHPFCLWLKDAATDEGAGWVCHATRIREGATGQDNARLAVGYMTKYFTKAVTEVILPPRQRRICTSRDIGSPRSKSKKLYSWSIKPAIHFTHVERVKFWHVKEGRLLDASDFGDDGYYPPLSD